MDGTIEVVLYVAEGVLPNEAELLRCLRERGWGARVCRTPSEALAQDGQGDTAFLIVATSIPTLVGPDHDLQRYHHFLRGYAALRAQRTGETALFEIWPRPSADTFFFSGHGDLLTASLGEPVEPQTLVAFIERAAGTAPGGTGP